MKNALLTTLLISFNVAASLSQAIKQTHIPLDNTSGIPFSKQQRDVFVDGFEIDKFGNYYFLGGNTISTWLVKFNGTKSIYRKKQGVNIGQKLYIHNDKVYTFNYLRNTLSVSGMDGEQISTYKKITPQRINSFRFIDSTLIVDNNDKVDISLTNYQLYTLTGQKNGITFNAYNIPEDIVKNKDIRNSVYLGKWNGKYLFWTVDDKRLDFEKYFLVNNKGAIEKTKSLNSKPFGHGFEDYEEFKKLRNGVIYIFGYKGKGGIITQLSVTEMFK
ncbi:MAG: hypothetical protein V4553_11975 [Bacteroidota bacterium]